VIFQKNLPAVLDSHHCRGKIKIAVLTTLPLPNSGGDMAGSTQEGALRFCVAVLHDRVFRATRDTWLWQIKARVADHGLALHAARQVSPAWELADISEDEKLSLLQTHPLLQDTRPHDASYHASADMPWSAALLERVRQYVKERSAARPE
jgi:hypothetical protein